jgi:hypothetical protein
MTATVAAMPAKQPPLPAPNSDFYEVYGTLNAEELATVKKVRAFMEAKVAPVITKYWVNDAFPFDLLPGVPVNKGLETSQDEGLLLEASYFGLCAGTEDKKEGTSAFLERRAPQFRGR